MTSKEEELIKILQSKQEELQVLNSVKESLEKRKELLSKTPEEIEESEPDIIEESDNIIQEGIEAANKIFEQCYEAYYPQYYQKYKKEGKVTCPACSKEFESFTDFIEHWLDVHQEKYGDFQKYKPTSAEEKTSQEEMPKTESKKELSPEDAMKLWLETKKRTRRKE